MRALRACRLVPIQARTWSWPPTPTLALSLALALALALTLALSLTRGERRGEGDTSYFAPTLPLAGVG